MNFQKNHIIEEDSQKKLKEIIDNKYCLFENKFSTMFILCKVKLKNKKSEYKILNLTDYYLINGHSCIEDLNDNTELYYYDKLVLKNNNIIEINNKKYKVLVATYKTNSVNKMILKELSSGNLFKIDLNILKNIEFLYEKFNNFN